jgi:NAD(P)-dependent dehydrogenase (short-subunit alcohol dehydrogenase family)
MSLKLPITTKPITSMKDAFSVAGQNVIVTGGNRGIGLGISKAYAECGAHVAILCRSVQAAQKAAEDLEKEFGGNHYGFACDISDSDSVKAAVEGVYGVFDHVDVLVNNAGIAGHVGFLEDQDMEQWNRIIQTNLNGPANVIHAVAPHMKQAGLGGCIINISSIAGLSVSQSKSHPDPGYNASKAALDHFTRYMAIELCDYGIRVNAISPGATHSDLDKNLPPETLDLITSRMPMHRFGEAIEIGALCVYLSSRAGSQVTGVVLPHDGGLVLV